MFVLMFGAAGVLMAVPWAGTPAAPLLDYAPAIYSEWGVDTPQPDTLVYDDGPVVRLYGGLFYAGMRFTPCRGFDLRTAYISISYYNHTSTCSVWVAADDGAGQGDPNNILTRAELTPAAGWQQVDFPDTITFSGNEDFHIIYGPTESTLHPNQLTGYYPQADYSSGNLRANLGYSWPTQPLTPFSYDFDWCIRAGGEYEPGTCPDAALANVDNVDLQWFHCQDDPVTFRATVENAGEDVIDSFAVEWLVVDDIGDTVFTTSGYYIVTVPIGGEATVTAPSSWTASTVGEYFVTATVTAPNDVVPDNNSKEIEQQVYDPSMSTLLDYEEGAFAGNLSLNPNNGRAMEFTPCSYPIEITNVEVEITADVGQVIVQVIGDDGTDAPDPGNVLFDTTFTTVTGVNSIPVGSIPITDGSFYVAYITSGTTNTSLPAANAPHAGNNATMGIVWATSTGGTSWTSSLSSDHPLRARIMAYGGEVRDITMDYLTFAGFFVPENTSIAHEVQVTNNGTQPDTFAVTLTIEDTTFARSVVFSETQNVVDLGVGDSTQLTFSSYNYATAGEYIVTAEAVVPGDASPGDNTIMAETQVCVYPSELTYDDGTFENGWAFNTAGNFWGSRFDPPIYPCVITGMRMNWSTVPAGYDNAKVQVIDDDGTTLLFNYEDESVVGGWNSYTIPNIPVMNSFFYAGSEWVTAAPNAPYISTDTDEPISYMARLRIGGTWGYDIEDVSVRVTVDALAVENVVIRKTGGTDNIDVNLSWSFSGIAGETYYFIYESDEPAGTYALVDSVQHPVQTWNDTNLPEEKKFYFVTWGDASVPAADQLPGEYLWSPVEIRASGADMMEPGLQPIRREAVAQSR
ncbi:hypothetical protein AMJ86_08500 [bacterium SM23_57]|nr:MAG: hypothetical protein AMJ86_08500 [bacterium SM23_57]